MAGEPVIEPEIVSRLFKKPRTRDRMEVLTQQERVVLQSMAEGRSNAGIARDLHLSQRTVETHVSSIFRAFGLAPDDAHQNRRVHAVITFLKAGGQAE